MAQVKMTVDMSIPELSAWLVTDDFKRRNGISEAATVKIIGVKIMAEPSSGTGPKNEPVEGSVSFRLGIEVPNG